MKSINTSILTAAAILFILNNSAFAYRDVIDLGPGCAYSINENGEVVGYSNTSTGDHAFLYNYSNGTIKDLGTLGGSSSHANSINNSGQIAGYAYNTSSFGRATLFYRSGYKIDLGTLGGAASNAYCINANGQIVGEGRNSSGRTYACRFNYDGLGHNLALETSSTFSRANSINDNGQIVGMSHISDNYLAYLFDSKGTGNNKNLGTLGGSESWAYSINNSDEIVGWAKDISGKTHACIFDITGNGNNLDLAPGQGNSVALNNNDLGQIVGHINYSAVLFDSTGHGNNINLNTLIDPLSGWRLSQAFCINNNGWIVGEGTYNGRSDAFLLTPEPATLLLFAFGGLALRRKR